jgi:hypothetical protein
VDFDWSILLSNSWWFSTGWWFWPFLSYLLTYWWFGPISRFTCILMVMRRNNLFWLPNFKNTIHIFKSIYTFFSLSWRRNQRIPCYTSKSFQHLFPGYSGSFIFYFLKSFFADSDFFITNRTTFIQVMFILFQMNHLLMHFSVSLFHYASWLHGESICYFIKIILLFLFNSHCKLIINLL